MRNFIENFITFIIYVLIILILIGIVMFCLDAAGLVKLPEKFSLIAMLNSNIEVRAALNENIYDNVINEDFDTVVKRRTEEKEKEKAKQEEEKKETSESTQKALEEAIKQAFGENQETEEVYEEDQNNFNKFYYSQLDTYAKIIYDKLYNNMAQLKTGTYTADYGTTFNDLLHQENGTEVLNNSFQLAINALTFDNPELFYIDVTKVYLMTETTTRAFSKTHRVSIGGNEDGYLSEEFNSPDVVKYSIGLVEQYRDSIISACEGLSTVEKVKYVNNYLIDNIEYDISAGNIYNIYGALVDKRAVCEGYARSCKYILDEMGIPCIIACGIGRNSVGTTESHAWNYVQIDGKWYALDVTWDDPIVNNGTGKVTEAMRYEYFLNGSTKFFEDHFEDGNIVGDASFEYPELSESNYE